MGFDASGMAGGAGHLEDNDGHIQGPKRYPSWAPELESMAMGVRGEGHILRDGPILRELEGMPSHYIRCPSNDKKRYRSAETEAASQTRRHLRYTGAKFH